MVLRYEKLYVNTLGELLIKKGEELIFSGHGNKVRKKWKLFLILLFNRGKVISDKRLIRELKLTENTDPNQALRALVYRLRKDIRNREGNYIFSENGGYIFNEGSPYWLDTKRFDQLVNKGDRFEAVERTKYYKQAIELYKGDFLVNQEVTSKELLQIRKSYRGKFIKVINQAAKSFRKQQKYQEAINLYETGLQIDNINVEFYGNLIKVLKKMNRPDQAVIRAEEALSIFNNYGVDMPEELEEEISELVAKQGRYNLDEVLASEPEKGESLEIGPITFSKILELERRRNQRNDRNIYLVDFKLLQGERPGLMIEAEYLLYSNLLNNLRAYDLFTRVKPGNYLLMLVDIKRSEAEEIIARIEEEYDDSLPPVEIKISYDLKEL